MIGLSNAAVTGIISWSLFLLFCGWVVGIMTVLDDSEELTEEEWELIAARRRHPSAFNPRDRSGRDARHISDVQDQVRVLAPAPPGARR